MAAWRIEAPPAADPGVSKELDTASTIQSVCAT